MEKKIHFIQRITNQICLKLKMINYIYIFFATITITVQNKYEIVVY